MCTDGQDSVTDHDLIAEKDLRVSLPGVCLVTLHSKPHTGHVL